MLLTHVCRLVIYCAALLQGVRSLPSSPGKGDGGPSLPKSRTFASVYYEHLGMTTQGSRMLPVGLSTTKLGGECTIDLYIRQPFQTDVIQPVVRIIVTNKAFLGWF